MGKFSAVEWQSFALKKDIEKINKKLNDGHKIQFSIWAEIMLVVFGVSLTNIFAKSKYEHTFWIIILIISSIIILVPFVQWIYRKILTYRTGTDLMSTKDFIDSFDNEICYYVLMAESYFTMLLDLPKNSDIDIKRFYFIEASYYVNKAIAGLKPIYNISDRVLTNSGDKIVSRRLIAKARYHNVCNILALIIDYLEKHKSLLDGLINKESILDSSATYKEILKEICLLVDTSQLYDEDTNLGM